MSSDISIDGVEYPTGTATIADKNALESLVSLDGERIVLANAPQTTQLQISLIFSNKMHAPYTNATVSDASKLREKLLAGIPLAVEYDEFINDAVLCDSCSITFPPATTDACTLECVLTIQRTDFLEPSQTFGALSVPSVPADLTAVASRNSNLFSSVNRLARGLQNLDALIPQLNAATFGRVRGMIKNCLAAAHSCQELMRRLSPDALLLNAYRETSKTIGALLDADSHAARLQQPAQIKTCAFTVSETTRVSTIARETGNSLAMLCGLNPGLKSPVRAGTVVRFVP